MRELDSIIEEFEVLKKAGTASVLATVVHVEGSSYRKAGARMLVDEFGNITGAISGGCLEGDALRKALLALHRQRNLLVTYDTSDEEDAIIGAQLGCNGIIQILFEPLDYGDKLNPCELLKNLLNRRTPVAVVVQFNLDKSEDQLGTLLIIDENSKWIGKPPGQEFFKRVLVQAELSLKSSQPRFAEVSVKGAPQHLFIQNYQPAIKLILIGAGNDAQILAKQANLLGWEVIVLDGRPSHANTARFTSSCQVIVSKPEETLSNIEIDTRTCVVLMSHNYHYDLSVLKVVLAAGHVPYIGILGPKKKFQRMLEDIGYELKPEALNAIFAPVGLDIGAETPAEIGLSILAEIQAVFTATSARSLREKLTPIHQQIGIANH